MKKIFFLKEKLNARFYFKSELKSSLIFALILIICSSYSYAKKSDPVLDFAKQQISQEFYMPALSTINSYLENNPKDRDATYWKAFCFYKLDNFVAAEINYAFVLKIDTKYLAAYVDMANMLVKQKKYNEAIPYFNTAIHLKDTVTDLLNSRGMCYYYADKFELAIKDFRRVLQLDPNNYQAYNNRGSAGYNNQDIAIPSIVDLLSSEKDFTKSLEIKPDFQLAFRNRGIVRYYMDSLASAYKDLLYASQLDPKDENAHYFLGKLLQKQKNYAVAIQFYSNAIRLVKNRSEFYLDRGICKLDMENYKDARKDFYLALQIGNKKGVIYYNIARVEAASGNKIECFTALRNAKKIGLFVDVKYFSYIAKDIYYKGWEKDKDFIELMKELKFGRNY